MNSESARDEHRKCQLLRDECLDVEDFEFLNLEVQRTESCEMNYKVTEPACGCIRFKNEPYMSSRYMRISNKQNMEEIRELMTKQWGLKLPTLLISVTGGAKNFKMDTELLKEVSRGLTEAAASTGAWVLTGGTHAGVMKYVGDAVRNHTKRHVLSRKVITLGVVPWGCISENHKLINGEEDGDLKFVDNFPFSSENENETHLDPGHSHFLMIDDGTKGKFGTEIEFRAQLEEAIVGMNLNRTGEENVSIPAVCLVLEGGKGTLETTKNSVEKNTPIVVIKGSGRAADVLAEVCLSADNESGKTMSDLELRQLVNKVMPHKSGKWSEEDEKKIIAYIRDILKYTSLVNVFDLKEENAVHDIDLAILNAIYRQKVWGRESEKKQANVMEQLDLALAWNRADMAKKVIDQHKLTEEGKRKYLMKALLNGKQEFVEMLINKGLALHDILNYGCFVTLYSRLEDSTDSANPQPRDEKELTMWKIRQNLKSVIGTDFVELLTSGSGNKKHKGFIMNNNPPRRDEASQAVDWTEFELFVWSLVSGKQQLSLFLWHKIPEQNVAAALLAEVIINKKIRRTIDPDQSQNLKELKRKFSQIAVGVLTDCHRMDEAKTAQLLRGRLGILEGINLMKLAFKADNKNFIAHQSCQNLLDNVWRGRLTTRTTFNLKVWLCMVLPVVIPFTIAFNSEHECRKAKQPEKLKVFHKFKYFFTSPSIKFRYSILSSLVFLLYYSYVVLILDFQQSISVAEGILIFWVGTLLTEEMRQLIVAGWREYFFEVWNIIDLISIGLFIIGEIIRSINCHYCHEIGHTIISANIVVFSFRLLHIFSIHRELGPKVVMIRHMMVDLIYFMVILLVFIVSFGVAMQAILYPNSVLNYSLLRNLIRRPYWQIYGELFLDEIEGECDQNAVCPRSNVAAPLVLAAYMLFANVLMLNLLIAMFSYTFAKVHENNDAIWKVERYYLVNSYYDRPPIPAPFIIISHFWMAVGSLRRKRTLNEATQHSYGINIGEVTDASLRIWEFCVSEEYYRLTKQKENETQTVEKLQLKVEAHFASIKESMEQLAIQRSDVLAFS